MNTPIGLEDLLLDFVRPKGQVIPYKGGDQKSAEMAGQLLQNWLDNEAKHLIASTKAQIKADVLEMFNEAIGKDVPAGPIDNNPDAINSMPWETGYNQRGHQAREAFKKLLEDW